MVVYVGGVVVEKKRLKLKEDSCVPRRQKGPHSQTHLHFADRLLDEVRVPGKPASADLNTVRLNIALLHLFFWPKTNSLLVCQHYATCFYKSLTGQRGWCLSNQSDFAVCLCLIPCRIHSTSSLC